MTFNSKSILCGIALLATSAITQAESFTFTNAGAGDVMTLCYKGQTEQVFVGALDGYLGSQSNKTESFCVDLDHMISPGQTYNVNPQTTSFLPSDSVYRMAGNVYAANIGNVHTADEKAALQVALWDTVYGNQFTLTGENATVQADVEKYLNTGKCYQGSATFLQETDNNGQSQIMATPEPCSMIIFGVGALGAFVRRRKFISA